MLLNIDEIQTISGKKMLLNVENYQGEELLNWAEDNKKDFEDFISQEGALLIRGLNINGADDFGSILKIFFGEDLDNYAYRSTPRTELKNKVYTATEYHASEVIPQHNENAYFNSWPMRIGFLCETPASKMGNTPISDSRIAYQEIPKEIREEFERKKIMYVRNYSNIDLPWQEVFQTSNKNEVEQFCKENKLDFEWTPEGLKTRQVNQASIIHPTTKEKLWFNQAHLFHVSSLEEELQEALIEVLGEDNLPRNTFFGDGTPIDPAALDIIRDVYEKTKFSFQWEKNDLLLLDNMLFTHGRERYEGPRKVLVGMARNFKV
ncbi:TauD/TfdA family dioxygenase [Flavobacterium sp. F-65]|uniref:TauD/TfdA family dioxygenase n=1 Tax=Flavobacterium pisciphilum TaxID=2893755 RepID=A0ABS8MNZ1_9FLAO|nr:TauD/TfdA family dioxygenase [Flavobacterium sp. F-65]MCC9070490.1 TauD/TfdA family dioxygenase [Flavobacterium sp. F-65]